MSHQPGAQLRARERRRRKRVENDTGRFLLGHSYKVQHPSRQSAQEELKRMRNKVGVEFFAYECVHCHRWHVGTKPEAGFAQHAE